MASACQRGGAAFLMFQLQASALPIVDGFSRNRHLDQALAGALAGLVTSPFHTVWEYAKINGTLPPNRAAYLVSLKPMMLRHAVFDATFFGSNSLCCSENPNLSHAGVRFAVSAATASFANLLFDVWKTRQMKQVGMARGLGGGVPRALPLRSVVATMTLSGFLRNYLVKGTDLTANWFAVGCVKEALFSPSS